MLANTFQILRCIPLVNEGMNGMVKGFLFNEFDTYSLNFPFLQTLSQWVTDLVSLADFDLPGRFDGYGLDTVAYGNVLVNAFSPIVTAAAVLGPTMGVAYGLHLLTGFGFLKSVGGFCFTSLVANYPLRYLMESVLDLFISALNMPLVIFPRRNMASLADAHFVLAVVCSVLILAVVVGLVIYLCRRKQPDKIHGGLTQLSDGLLPKMRTVIVFVIWFFGFRLAVAAIVALSAVASKLLCMGLMVSAALVSLTVNVTFKFLESRWQQVVNLIMEALLVVLAVISLVDAEKLMDITDKALVGTIVTGIVLGTQLLVFLIVGAEMLYNLCVSLTACL